MKLGLKNKAAIVTGASSGLGLACAESLAREGVRLVICSRNFDRVFQAARTIAESCGAEIIPIAADISQPDSPSKLVREAVTKFGTVDILVNNSGGPPPGTFSDMDDEAWEGAFRLTLMSAVRMTRAVLPTMTEHKWGRVINLASISVKQPIPNLILSNSLRSAVVGMAKTLAAEVAADNVLVNTIATGSFDTDRLRSIIKKQAEGAGISEGEAQVKWASAIPMGRIGDPSELADFVTFLASEKSSYITGNTIQIDGGAFMGLM